MALRILLVHTAYRQSGGEDAVVDRQAALLAGGGHDVDLFRFENPAGARESVFGLVRAPWNPASARVLRERIEAFGPDVVHVHNTWFAASPAVFATVRRAGAPLVVTLHNYRPLCANALLFRDGAVCEDCVGHLGWRGVVRRCYRDSAVTSAAVAGTSVLLSRQLAWADRLVVPSRTAGERFRAAGHTRLKVIPHAIPDPGPRLVDAADSDMVVFAGRLSAEKGLEQVVVSWPSSRMRLHVFGDGPERSRLEAVARPGVVFRGWSPPEEVATALRSARALVFPSVVLETFGLAVGEALAAGTPAFVTAGTAASELIEAGGGWSVRSQTGWDNALSVLEDPAQVSQRAVEARAVYESSLSPAVGLRRLVELYEAVLTHR